MTRCLWSFSFTSIIFKLISIPTSKKTSGRAQPTQPFLGSAVKTLCPQGPFQTIEANTTEIIFYCRSIYHPHPKFNLLWLMAQRYRSPGVLFSEHFSTSGNPHGSRYLEQSLPYSEPTIEGIRLILLNRGFWLRTPEGLSLGFTAEELPVTVTKPW